MCLLASITLTQALARGDNGSFPEPYVYKDKGVGRGRPEFSFNKSGLLPDWLSLSVQHRTRYETLNSQFRSGTSGSDQVLSLRTLAQATIRLPRNFRIQLELQDSRAELADSGTRMNTAIVNSAELLEGNIQWLTENLFQDGDHSVLRAGRITMDVGKRRLVARNRFRNTKNAFTGVDWIWKTNGGTSLRGLAVLPVDRQPTASQELLGNEASFDEESFNCILWGIFLDQPILPWGDKGEFYLFGLHEDDALDFATSNRQLYTPGFRLYRSKKKERLDYEWESIFQFGESRASTASTDTQDLDHFAYYHHAEVGYSFSSAGSPRLVLAYDYASGDTKPNDDNNGRFDSLFGGNAFDFGPTSIHRPFVRSNVQGPGVKIFINPHKTFNAYLHYRALWLASDTDSWSGNSGLRDNTGNSDSFLGQQLFLRGKWQALPNVLFDGGIAYRIDGDFQDTVPNSPQEGDTLYSYVAMTLSF